MLCLPALSLPLSLRFYPLYGGSLYPSLHHTYPHQKRGAVFHDVVVIDVHQQLLCTSRLQISRLLVKMTMAVKCGMCILTEIGLLMRMHAIHILILKTIRRTEITLRKTIREVSTYAIPTLPTFPSCRHPPELRRIHYNGDSSIMFK